MTGGNPLLINVVELRRSVGNQKTVSESVELDDVGLASVRGRGRFRIDVDLLLETVVGRHRRDRHRHRAVGTASADDASRRSEGPLDVEVAEVFEEHPTEGETYPIAGDHIDLEPMVRELAILGLPINPLCRDDCAGPVPDVLPVSVESDEEAEPAPDPRWAALDALRDLT